MPAGVGSQRCLGMGRGAAWAPWCPVSPAVHPYLALGMSCIAAAPGMLLPLPRLCIPMSLIPRDSPGRGTPQSALTTGAKQPPSSPGVNVSLQCSPGDCCFLIALMKLL